MTHYHTDSSFWTKPGFAFVVFPVLALLFNWPYLKGGFFSDDIIMLNILLQDPAPFSRWLGVWSANEYTFIDHLWWSDFRGLESSGLFWRPIPSLFFEGSLYLFGQNAFPLHLLSILLHGGVTVGIYLLVRKLTGRHGLAILAGLFFVTCEDHSMQIGWISTITDLFAVQFILLALLAHVHWLKRRQPVALAGSLLALIVALGCKETSSIAPVAIVLLTFLMPSGSDGEDLSFSGLGRRIIRIMRDLWSWLPATLILAAYLVAYKLMDMGNINSLLYVNPFIDPIRFVSHMLLHMPVMWLGTLSPIPPYLTMFEPGLLTLAAIMGSLALLVWLVALWPFRRRPLVVWSLALYFVALVPQMAADASERGLYFPMVAACIFLAVVAATIGPLVRRKILEFPVRSRWTRFIGWVAILGVLIPGTILSAASPWSFLPGFSRPEKELRTALPHIEQHDPEYILILNTSGMMNTIYTWDILNYISNEQQESWVLSSANGIFSLERTGDSSFVINTDRAGWLGNFFARLVRSTTRYKPGDRFETALFDATVMQTTRSGNDILSVRFDLTHPLSTPGWLFLCWNGESFVPLDIAALEVGKTVKLADTSDLWKSMM